MHDARRARLARLRQRLVTVTLRSRSLRLVKPTAAGALDLLRVGESDPRALDALVAALGREGGDPVALCDVVPKAKERALADDLASLAHATRSAWQETGIQDLAVGFPFVEGKMQDGAWIRGPVLLFPVTLSMSKTGRARWCVAPQGPPELNESLAQVLARGLGARLDARALVGDDEQPFAIDATSLARIASALEEAGVTLAPDAGRRAGFVPIEPRDQDAREAAPAGRITLAPHLVLGRFPRSDSAILEDYEKLLAGDVSDEALGAAARLLSVDEVDDDASRAQSRPPIDETSAPIESVRFRVFPSDSSQDAALSHAFGDAGNGAGLVVQGPPGTGKSQMIANLVAEAIAAGRRVLVVCQKRAALDVVAERLASVGLREPVAMVHDLQHDRAEVCESVARTLQQIDGATSAALTDLEREALDEEREHALVAGRAAARIAAAEEAFAVIAGTPGGAPGLARLFERASSDDGATLPDLRDVAAGLTETQAVAELPRIESLCRQTAPFQAPHPLASRTDWSARGPEDLAATFDRARRARDRIEALAAAPSGALQAGVARSQGDLWGRTAVLLDLFEARDEAAIKAFMLSWAWAGGDAETGAWRQVTARLTEARATFAPVPHELLLLPSEVLAGHVAALARLDELGARWYRGVTPEYWRLKKLPGAIVAACPSLTAPPSSAAEVRALCESALRWQRLIDELPSEDCFWDLGLGGALEDLDHALERFREEHARIAAAHELFTALRRAGGPYASRKGLAEAVAEHGAEAPFFAAAVADRVRARRLDAVHEALAALSDDFDDALRAAVAEACAHDDCAGALSRLDAILEVREQASAVAQVDRLLAATPPWVRVFLRGYRPSTGSDPGRDALVALDRAWVRRTLGDRTLGVVEEPLVDEGQLRRLSDDLEACEQRAGRGVIARFRQRLWADARDAKRGVGLRKLAAEVAKKRNRATLRQLVDRHWGSGLALSRPVWFCSPEAVSAIFPLSADLFDIVIADEASQCPVEAALPALARGRRTIIAGDDQQMPPTHFFRAAVADALDDDDDEESVLASSSILGLARVALPGLVLRWHYRSRHEELVAFSNAAFYGGHLITAPRADARVAPFEGLTWEKVDGLWVDQTNPVEAKRVVAAVDALLAHDGPEGPPSIGVVAVNRKQAELIERTLDARAAEDDAFRRRWERDRARPAVDQLFVRNLENVQGDERDVIILSTGYAPAAPGGRVHARFGPIGAEGGERRLNVAMTRARIGLHVVSSIDPDELDVAGTKNVGPKLLQAYLAFVEARADRGRPDADLAAQRLLALAAELGGARGVTAAARAPDGQRRIGDRVRDALDVALRSRGLRTQKEVGLGHRRIDLAVGRPGEDHFRVGVDCTQFLRDRDALSRDVYTPRFWKRLGWRVVRVTPGMWHTRGDEVVAAIASMIDA
ncbi:DNA helicase [Minicystis rosea]|nr:DNA helicase [Minicystis rosea]